MPQQKKKKQTKTKTVLKKHNTTETDILRTLSSEAMKPSKELTKYSASTSVSEPSVSRIVLKDQKLAKMNTDQRRSYERRKKIKREIRKKTKKLNKKKEQIVDATETRKKIDQQLKLENEKTVDFNRYKDLYISQQNGKLGEKGQKELEDLIKKYGKEFTGRQIKQHYKPKKKKAVVETAPITTTTVFESLSASNKMNKPPTNPTGNKVSSSSFTTVQAKTTKGNMDTEDNMANQLVNKLEKLGYENVVKKHSGKMQKGHYVYLKMDGFVNNNIHFHTFKEIEKAGGWRLVLRGEIIIKNGSNDEVLDLRLLNNYDNISERGKSYDHNSLIIRKKIEGRQQVFGSVSILNQNTLLIKQLVDIIVSNYQDVDKKHLLATLNVIFTKDMPLRNLWTNVRNWYFGEWSEIAGNKLFGGNNKTQRKQRTQKIKRGINLYKIIKKTVYRRRN